MGLELYTNTEWVLIVIGNLTLFVENVIPQIFFNCGNAMPKQIAQTFERLYTTAEKLQTSDKSIRSFQSPLYAPF